MKRPEAPGASGEIGEKPASLSPGVAALLRGRNEKTTLDTNAGSGLEEDASGLEPGQGAEPGRDRWPLRVALLLADLLLLALVATLVFGTKAPVGGVKAGLCAVAILTGAWLSWLALRRE